MAVVSATELARNTRQILDKVAGNGETIAVERNQVVVAKIMPVSHPMTAAQTLAGLKPTLSPIQGEAWLNDSRHDFDHGIRDPWE